MVDRTGLTCLPYTVRPYGALPAAACKLGDVLANNLAGHMVWISASVIQPVEEMRKPYGICALGIGGAIAPIEFDQELIARSNAHTSCIANAKRGTESFRRSLGTVDRHNSHFPCLPSWGTPEVHRAFHRRVESGRKSRDKTIRKRPGQTSRSQRAYLAKSAATLTG